MVYKQNPVEPTAKIAVNKNRLKVYNEEQVYLTDRQHFQIELYNPLSTEVLAVIKINNELIGNTGIVLRPAERVFLERYLNNPKKFQFSTYIASGSKTEIENAIINNGQVEVNFFKKEEVINLGAPVFNFYSNTGTGTGDFHLNPSFTSDINTTFDSSISSNSNIQKSDWDLGKNRGLSKSIETGRVSEGENSNQKLVSIDMTFNTFPCATSKYLLLPQSQKQLNVEDTYHVRQHCDECGSRIRKKTAKFCWNCGERL